MTTTTSPAAICRDTQLATRIEVTGATPASRARLLSARMREDTDCLSIDLRMGGPRHAVLIPLADALVDAQAAGAKITFYGV